MEEAQVRPFEQRALEALERDGFQCTHHIFERTGTFSLGIYRSTQYALEGQHFSAPTAFEAYSNALRYLGLVVPDA